MSGMLSWQVKSVLLENREHGMMGKPVWDRNFSIQNERL